MDTKIETRVVFLLVVLSVSVHAHRVPIDNVHERKFSFWHKKTVRVYNNLGDGINLTLHCKSKNDDLGIQTLTNGETFEWRFRPNIFGTTLFFCGVSWNDKSGIYDLYKDERDSGRCRECIWKVTTDGVRGYNQEGGAEQIWFRWVPKPPSS